MWIHDEEGFYILFTQIVAALLSMCWFYLIFTIQVIKGLLRNVNSPVRLRVNQDNGEMLKCSNHITSDRSIKDSGHYW